jgi:hypothetical protein
VKPVDRREEPIGDPAGWRIVDHAGEVVAAGFRTRKEAIRALGKCAGASSALPLSVVDAQGKATGDRLG